MARKPAAPAATPAAPTLPSEPVEGDWTVAILAAMMFIAPALGSPSEELLQDTLKSMIVSLTAIGAAVLFFVTHRARRGGLRWHAVVWLPLLLISYALGSMAWSHAYLGGVEAIRWFVFAVILWLTLNTMARERVEVLAWGIHAGAVVASLWAALQFWFGFSLFPQGPNPGSTFVNRNFFAEFAVCTLPFSALLIARARQSAVVALLSASAGLVVVALLMTGTRAALLAMWLQLLVVLPFIAWRCRRQLAFAQWPASTRLVAAAALLATVAGLGVIPSANPRILEEERGATALERGLRRTQSIGPNDPSLGVRQVMWRAALRAIAARPLTGVGAGAWESEIPLYQDRGSQIETDYYVHNEALQLLAEYGVAGWLFLLGLAAYLLSAAWRTWKADGTAHEAEVPLRAVALCSLFALMVVSNIGFPWRLAATGALFALALGVLAASDARMGLRSRRAAWPLPWSTRHAQVAALAGIACFGLGLYVSAQAAKAERKLVHAARLALTINRSGNPQHPQWAATKRELLQLVREGVAINPHYRKITPMVADELARWGDWTNAIWIWDSVLGSRPYVVAIISNVARGYSTIGDMEKARAYLDRAKKLQPDAAATRSLEVIVLARSGDEPAAVRLAKASIAAGIVDFDMLNAGITLGARSGDFELVRQSVELRGRAFPQTRVAGYTLLGSMYAGAANDPAKAVDAFRMAMKFASDTEKAAVLAEVPAPLRARVEAPAAP
ncbi:O-antigen ligase family protein [Ramlibacter sp.]|uniref:O-antigen ligase family protein n=1 Tax=Ramlibacter sp. TaxID=1917967 RepID=UPI003D11E7F7